MDQHCVVSLTHVYGVATGGIGSGLWNMAEYTGLPADAMEGINATPVASMYFLDTIMTDEDV